MECKVIGESIFAKEVLFEGNCEQAVDVDFTLPDYCPDIGKLLKCRVEPMISSREVNADSLVVEGNAKISVIYLDDKDKKIRCCDRDYPFKASVPYDNSTENVKLSVESHVDYMNCRAVSQRKLDIHGAFTLHLIAVCGRMNEIMTGAEGDGLRLKKCRCDISSLVNCTQSSFDISEAIELGDGKPPISSVIRTSTVLCVEDCKTITNKLIVKGDAIFNMVYCTDRGDELEHMEYIIPFNQFFDIQGIDDSCMTDLRLLCDSTEVSLRTDADGEYRRINIDVRAMADVKAYRSTQAEWVTDAYSVDYEVNCRQKQIKLEKLCSSAAETFVYKQSVDTGEIKIDGVSDIWCTVLDSRSSYRDGKTIITGNMAVSMIVRDQRQGVMYTEKTVRYECAMSQESSGQIIRPECSVVVKSCNYTITGESKLEIQAELYITSALYEDIPTRLVGAIDLDENRPKSKESRPAAVLYFAEKGEELWDIAREYNSSVESIKEDNDIDGETVPEGRLLIVTA